MYLCEQEKRRPASMQISLFISTRVHQWYGGTDGRTDTVLIGRSLSTGSATCKKFNFSEKACDAVNVKKAARSSRNTYCSARLNHHLFSA